MAHAFVVEYDGQNQLVPIIAYADQTWSADDRYGNSRQCSFVFKFYDKKHCCTYRTKSAYDARVLSRLMNQMSKFQIHSHVHDTINKHAGHGYRGLSDILSAEEQYIDSLGDDSGCSFRYHYDYDNPEFLCPGEMPFSISEIDTKKYQGIKPYLFYQEYKLRDENGRPLYVAVILERKNNGESNEDLFNYNVKFIGSGQPLEPAKLWKRAPRCDDDKLYQSKIDEYNSEHWQDIFESSQAIRKLISEEGFDKHFKTYEFLKSKKWRTCEPVLRGVYCRKLGSDVWGNNLYCNYSRCPHYNGYEPIYATHDGIRARDLFKNAFGPKITKLVEQDAVDRGTIPDVSNPEFIKAFKEFCYEERVGTDIANKMTCFDESGAIQGRKKHLDTVIQHINDWANTPGFDIIRFKTRDGNVHTISSLRKQPEYTDDEQNEKPETATRLATLKTKLLEKNMERVAEPAIYIKSPGKIEIIECIDQPYMTEFAKDEYDEFVDVYVNYKKPKLKETQEIVYRFAYTGLGYDFLDVMSDIHIIQKCCGNFKWAPSKLFPKDMGPAPKGTDSLFRRLHAKEDVIPVLRTNVDYNGITILNPKQMKPIVCDHYEIHTLEHIFGNNAVVKPSKNILLFNAKNEVSGIIRTKFDSGIKDIIPNIIVQNMQQKPKAR